MGMPLKDGHFVFQAVHLRSTVPRGFRTVHPLMFVGTVPHLHDTALGMCFDHRTEHSDSFGVHGQRPSQLPFTSFTRMTLWPTLTGWERMTAT